MASYRDDFLDAVGHVFHPYEESNGQPFGREFLFHRGSVKTVVQVVVFRGREVGDGTETAVVVGQHQAVGRHHFRGAAVAEDRHRILERRVIDAVDLFRSQLQAMLLHVHIVEPLDKDRQPHTLVGTRLARKEQAGGQQGREEKSFFHRRFEFLLISCGKVKNLPAKKKVLSPARKTPRILV